MIDHDTLSEHARDIAFVTFSMTEIMEGLDETALPGRSRYHLFNGFMGFCNHAGHAGLTLAKACHRHEDDDDWIDIVDAYAGFVVRHAIRTGAPASDGALRRFVLQARRAISKTGAML